jgi:hypothetical protein
MKTLDQELLNKYNGKFSRRIQLMLKGNEINIAQARY